MKKILISLMVIVVAVAMVGAGTFAHFSDEELTPINFTAGTLDLHPDDEDIEPFPALANINPCVWYKVFEEWLHNAGNKPGNLTLHLTNLVEGNGVDTEPEIELAEELKIPNPSNVSDYTDVIVVYCYDAGTPLDPTDDNVLHIVRGSATWEEAEARLIAAGVPEANIIYAGKLGGVICEPITLDPVMMPGEGSTLQILLHMEQPDIVNLYQGDTCSFDIVLGLVEVPELK